MKTKKLSDLLQGIVKIDASLECRVTGLALDSREVNKGNIFFACIGEHADGRKFIDAAIEKGAVAVISDSTAAKARATSKQYKNKEIPIIRVPDLKQQVSEIAARFYNRPSKDLMVIAVTGTNGKTSCCHFIAQALTAMGKKVGVLGTVGNGLWGQHKESQLTTPDPIALQQLLAEFKVQNATHVIMEASSHGIVQGRMNAIECDIAIFTNLTREHLDYHGSMEAYGNAKRKLFENPYLKYAVINIDDEFGRQLSETLQLKMQLFAYSASGRLSEKPVKLTRAHQVHVNIEGITASIYSPWGDGVLHTQLIGRFNLSNLLAVLTTLGILGFSIQETINLLADTKGVPGRMELFGGKGKPYVIVDYAHTPDALRQVLTSLKEYLDGELWCIFGCGGDRDQGKRAQMGQISETLADRVIITDDNPRHEQPQDIVADILQGMSRPEFAVVEHDRRRAISHGINCAQPGDIVLISGKGHESYQQYGDNKNPFNDELEVQMVLAEYAK